MSRIEEVKARVEKATEGPWSRSKQYKLNIISDATGQIVTGHATPNSPNAEFIAHAREDIPWLIEQMEDAQREMLSRELHHFEVEEENATLREQLRKAQSTIMDRDSEISMMQGIDPWDL